MLSRERFEKACRFEPVDRPPVWMMRQAGRTLKEYLALREKYSFWELCKTPELAMEVTLQPLRRYPVDAAIIFSDILVIPEAMGMDVQFSPKMSLIPPIRDKNDVDKLRTENLAEKLNYVAQALKLVHEEVGHEKAVLGFSGAPFTLACYMVEGGSSKHFLKIREAMYHQPEVFHRLMDKLAGAVIQYFRMQAGTGVTAVQLFDTWAGELSTYDYDRFVLPYVKKVIDSVPEHIPVIYYINGIGNLLTRADETGADVIGVDWRLNLCEVRHQLGARTVVQGNLDPAVLVAPHDIIRDRVFRMLDMTGGQGHIVNLGHGLIPDTPISGISTFVQAVFDWAEQNKRNI